MLEDPYSSLLGKLDFDLYFVVVHMIIGSMLLPTSRLDHSLRGLNVFFDTAEGFLTKTDKVSLSAVYKLDDFNQ